MSGSRTLSGAIRLLDAAPTPSALRVKVEDVSRADAAARIVGEAIVQLDLPLAAGASVPFSISIPEVSEGIQYNVRAHIDCSGSGQISAGDLISTQAYPIFTHGHTDNVIVDVQAV